MMSEWKPIPSLLNQYEASDAGEIRSVRRRSTRGRVIKPYINKRNGYAYIVASVNNTQKTYRVHRLVAEAFLGESNGAQVNHIDGNKQNNADDFTYTTGDAYPSRKWYTDFDTKWYLTPIPSIEINKGYGMTQNPGW